MHQLVELAYVTPETEVPFDTFSLNEFGLETPAPKVIVITFVVVSSTIVPFVVPKLGVTLMSPIVADI